MARLDPAKRNEWKKALAEAGVAWVAVGIDFSEPNASARLEGMPGLVDWALHGQVSRLMLQERLGGAESCLVPGDPALGRPSFLFFPVRAPNSVAAFLEQVRGLQVKEIALAESTFGEDFLAKVKQTFKKEGIRFTTLEPSS